MANVWETAGEPAAEQTTTDLPFAEYWAVIVRRRRLIALCIGVALAVTAIVSLMADPTYQAVTVLSVEKEVGGLNLPGNDSAGSYDPEFLPTQMRLMKSRGIAERVVRRLNMAGGPQPEPAKASAQSSRTKPDEPASVQAAVTSAALGVASGVEVDTVRGTNLVELSYVSSSPESAARIANAVADAYIDWNMEQKYRALGETSEFLTTQIDTLKKELATQEQQLLAYGRQKDILTSDPRSSTAVQNLDALNTDYTGAVAERVAKEARYHELRNANPESVADTVSSGMVFQLRNEQNRLEREYAEKLNLYKPEWPAMQQLKVQIDKGRQHLDSAIQQAVTQARETARNDYQTALRRESSLRGVLGSQKSEAMALTGNAVEYNNLRVEIDNKKALLDSLSKRLGETEVLSRLRGETVSNVRIVDRALLPGSRHSPSYRKNGMIGLLVGTLLGVGLAFALSYMDRSLRTAKDVERHLQLPALGVIPAVGGTTGKGRGYTLGSGLRRKKGLVEEEAASIELLPHLNPRSRVAERYRVFRTALLLSRAGGVKSIVITSSFSQEGKTATAANLAVVMAQLGKRTLLVDADLHRPRLHEIFRVSNRVGLVSVLAENLEPARSIVKTDVPDLFLVPSGPATPNPSGLLSSEGMSKFLDLASMNFDFLILDGPPVAPVADSLLLGHLTDGAVICVQGGRTPREHVARVRDRLLRSNVRILGVVVNNVEETGDEYGRRYGYDDAYYYGGRSLETPEKVAASGRTG